MIYGLANDPDPETPIRLQKFPSISSHSLAATPSAAVGAILPTHLPSAAVRAAKLAHHQRLLLPTHFQTLICTQAVRSRPRSSPHPLPVRSRPRRQARSSPASSPPPISSHSVAPTPSAAVRAILRTHFPSAAVRAAEVADLQRLLLPTHFQPLPGTHAVRSRPRSQARSSPAASSPHPFPATPWHPRRPQQSAQFSAPISRPQPSAQPSSLITSGFFSPTISSHRCTHAVRSRPRSPNSLISSGFFSHSFLSLPFPSSTLQILEKYRCFRNLTYINID